MRKLAVDFDRGYGKYFEKRDEIIRTYKQTRELARDKACISADPKN